MIRLIFWGAIFSAATLLAHSFHNYALAEPDHSSTVDEPRPYDANANAQAELDMTLHIAEATNKMTLLVMGANWCHDSRGLAAQFEKPRFQALISEHYELLYVDVGRKNRNIDIAQRFGLSEIVGTPTVFVLSPEGNVLNYDTAPTWRNAASRTEDDIYDAFEAFTREDVSSNLDGNPGDPN